MDFYLYRNYMYCTTLPRYMYFVLIYDSIKLSFSCVLLLRWAILPIDLSFIRVSSAKVFCWGIVSLLGLFYPIHTCHFYVFKKCVVQVRVVFRVFQKVSCSLLLLSCWPVVTWHYSVHDRPLILPVALNFRASFWVNNFCL